MFGRKLSLKIDLRSKFNILVFLCTNLDYRDFKYQYLYGMGITAACRTLLPSSISQSSHFQSVISGKKLNGRPCHCSADFWNWSICFFCLCNDYKTSYAVSNKCIRFELALSSLKELRVLGMYGLISFAAHVEN